MRGGGGRHPSLRPRQYQAGALRRGLAKGKDSSSSLRLTNT